MPAQNNAQTGPDHDGEFSPVILVQPRAGDPVAWVPAHHKARVYIDTLHVEVKRPISGAQLQDLRRLCRGVEQMRPKRANCPKWRRVLHIQQPSREALEWLRDELGSRGTITRVDVSLDLLVTSKDAAVCLQVFFERHLMQRWHGKRITFRQETTQYWSDVANTTRNLVVYSDQPSKGTDAPCCHIEHRTCTADACRRRGLGTFEELLDLDYQAFWKRELYLKAIDRAKLERAIDRRAREAMRANPLPLFVQNLEVDPGQARRQALREKISADVARLLNVPASNLHMVKAQDLKDVAAWLADKCLVMIPNDHFLVMVNRYDSVVRRRHHHLTS